MFILLLILLVLKLGNPPEGHDKVDSAYITICSRSLLRDFVPQIKERH